MIFAIFVWDTVTLGSGRNTSTNNTDASQSICPRGWRLPASRYTSTFDTTIAAESNFYNLAINYGMSANGYGQGTTSFSAQAGPNTAPNFILSGYYGSGRFFNNGGYWSSTQGSGSMTAYYLSFNSSYVSTNSSLDRSLGFSVRCLVDI